MMTIVVMFMVVLCSTWQLNMEHLVSLELFWNAKGNREYLNLSYLHVGSNGQLTINLLIYT